MHSLRWRVAASLLLVSVALILLQTVALYVVTEGQEDEFIDVILTDEMALLERTGFDRADFSLRTGMRLHSGARDGTGLPEVLRALDPGLHEVWIGGVEHHALVRDYPDRRLVLTYDATPHERRIERFLVFLLLGMVSTGALAVLLAWGVSRLLARQVTDLAERVAGLDPSQAQPALSGAYRDAEVATLARAFDAYAQRVAELLEREKAFTGDVSHELRTPLAAISSGCELLAEDASLDERSRARVARMAEAARRMRETIEAMLFLAREIPGDQIVAVDLHELVCETAAPLAALKPLRFAIDVPERARVRAWRPGLRMVIDNLLRNAYAYTEHGEVRVAFDGQRLSVSDTGAGIAAEDLPHIFERRYRAAGSQGGGNGLGLAIVRRIADRYGWGLEVDSVRGRGSTFRVVFPLAS